jgi:hypothetical protein
VLWQESKAGENSTFGAWAVRWSIEEAGRVAPGSSALDELAERMGIESQFQNARGETVKTNSDTKRSLLAAMGVEAIDEAQARGALEALDRAEWLRPLPAAQVLRVDGGPPALGLVLPASTGEIVWRLIEEDGSERTDRVAFADLELVDAGSFDGTPSSAAGCCSTASCPGAITAWRSNRAMHR